METIVPLPPPWEQSSHGNSTGWLVDVPLGVDSDLGQGVEVEVHRKLKEASEYHTHGLISRPSWPPFSSALLVSQD